MISVGNLVQRPSWRGKGRLVIPSRTELFPADWSPQTTSWGRLMRSPMPRERRLAICSSRLLDFFDCRMSNGVVEAMGCDFGWPAG